MEGKKINLPVQSPPEKSKSQGDDMATLTCGDVKLLAAIFGKCAVKLGEKLGIPMPVSHLHLCLGCGTRTRSQKTGLCRECLKASKRIDVACSECGQLTPRLASQIITDTARGYQHFFCDHHCQGRYLGKLNRKRKVMTITSREVNIINKALEAYEKAGEAYDKAEEDYHKAWEAYNEAWEARKRIPLEEL